MILIQQEVIPLHRRFREALSHGLVAFLYALGLALTLLGVTELLEYGWMAVGLLAALIAVLTAATLNRKAAYVAAGAALVGGVGWLALGGMSTMIEVLRATVLHMSGLKTALPLVAQETAVLVCVLCAAASYFVTQRSAGAYPALVLLLLIVVMLWLGDQTQALWCLLPSVVASVTLLMQSSGEDVRTSRVLPLAVVAVLLSFSGVALGGVSIGTMKDAADALRQRIYDLFFFTAPRDVFSLASEGYYPQGQGQLGGPATPNENPVMIVTTPRKTYLRGVIKNTYTGRVWLDETEGKRYLWSSLRWQGVRSTAFDMDLPDVTDLTYSDLLAPSHVTVRMLADSASSMFVPQRTRSLDVQGDLVPYFNVGSEIFATRNLELGDVWAVEAPLFKAGDAGVRQLVSACESANDPNWEYVNQTYRALPGHLEQEVYNVAYEAAAGAAAPYDMALSIQQYLQANYTYTLDVEPQLPELDFVSSFLLLSREGYCTYFASAMTVMCRMVGLPARYVEGYLATPDASGQAIVTGKEGHAWTEVYFKGFGWLTFDATPVSSETVYITPEQLPSGGENDEDTEPAPEPTATPSPEPGADAETPAPPPTATPEVPIQSPTPTAEAQPDQPDEPAAPVRRASFNAWWLLVVAAAAAIAGRIVWMLPGMQAKRQKHEFGRWLVWTQAIHDALRMRGLARLPSETPLAFFARVEAEGKLPVTLKVMGEAESLMFYGHAVPMPEETMEACRLYGQLAAVLKPWQRVLVTLQRAFLPRRTFDIARS